MSNHFKTQSELEAIVRGFEECTTAATDFPHRSHLVLATWYLGDGDRSYALDRMRASILNFLEHYGITGKYNETITLFWIIMVERVLGQLPRDGTLLEQTNAVVETLNDSRLMFEYYSRELLWTEQAMREWVDPDLKPLAVTDGGLRSADC
ncbi:MAG TPA: hypothetical protein VN643_17180 [Pyrinomonadaceae bacterium]|nr:hypothetical protein [Pyrinomonadaceae bacterium]